MSVCTYAYVGTCFSFITSKIRPASFPKKQFEGVLTQLVQRCMQTAMLQLGSCCAPAVVEEAVTVKINTDIFTKSCEDVLFV